jgi:hypothetical protein
MLREVELLQLVRVSEKKKTNCAAHMSVDEDGGRPSTGIPEILKTEATIAEI